MADKIKQRRDTQANWEAVNPILDQGELGWITDRNTGKLGDGAHGFNELQSLHGVPEGWVNVKDFGAVGDGVHDDTLAIQNALNYIQTTAKKYFLVRPFEGSNAFAGPASKKPLYFPEGIYRITQPITLPSDASYSGYNFIGAGMYSSILEFDVAETEPNVYMFDIPFNRTIFANLSFYSKNINGNLFHFPSPSHLNTFYNVYFVDFDTFFTIDGTTMGSEFRFFNCFFINFQNYAFSINNSQALNWGFYGCEFRIQHGSAFKMYTQCPITMYQGGINFRSEGAKFIEIPEDADTGGFGYGNNQLTFYNLRFELGNNYIIYKKTHAKLHAIFNNCNFSSDSTFRPNAIYWEAGGKLAFTSCTSMRTIGMQWKSIPHVGSLNRLTLIIDSYDFDVTNFLNNSSFTLSSADNNTDDYPTLEIRDNTNTLLRNKIIKVKGKSLRRTQQNWRSYSIHPEDFTIMSGTLPLSSPPIYLPNIYLSKIRFSPLVSTNANSSITIDIKNSSDVILGSFTYNPNIENAEQIIDINYFIEPTDYLTISVSGDESTYFRVKGSLWFLY